MAKRRKLDFDLAHLIELLLIAVFAGIVMLAVGLGVMLVLPGARTFLDDGAAASLPETPTLSAAIIPTTGVVNTPTIAPSLTPSLTPSATSPVADTPIPSTPVLLTPTPTVLLPTAPASGFACDRPGWFPEQVGIREHAIFRYKDQTYLMAAQQPGRHALLVARTSDLCHWEQLPSALTQVRLDAWDGKDVRTPFVFEQNGLYNLFYTGITWNGTERILWATTNNPADSNSWVVQGEAFRPNHPEENWPAGGEATCRAPVLLRDGELYYLYYTGKDSGGGIIGVAVASSPGGPWADLGAILPAIPDGLYENPFVAAYQGAYYLFYHHPQQGTQYRISESPTGPWSAPFDLAPGWAHEIWQQGDLWFTSFLTDYSVTIFPLAWDVENGQIHPQIKTPSAFLQDIPIWAHADEPAPHEVTLFRHTFTLKEPLDTATISLFADTRYEAWLDGEWLGRGPARFSYRLREYDVYTPGRLEAGEHTLAVLVQWAPNNRRSESVAPFLQGHVQGQDAAGQDVIIRTNAAWKAQRSSAWQSDGALVHSWGLIGPVELLDLSLLDANWNQPGFNDTNWPNAVVINPSVVNYQPYRALYLEGETGEGGLLPEEDTQETTGLDLAGAVSGVIYRPRSIPPLADVPMAVKVLDAGLLSPGFSMGELPPAIIVPYVLPFTVEEDTYFTIEAPGMIGPAVSIQLDGEYIGWQKADATRPDVYTARVKLFRGPHKITFERISQTGLTFSVSNENVRFQSFPFSQGLHVGRRLLLAQPVSDTTQVTTTIGMDAITLDFPAMPSYVVLDLGRTVHGRIQVDVTGPAGAVLDMGWDERLLPGTLRPLPFPGSLYKDWNQVDSWVLDGTARTISTLDTRAGRYILIASWADQPLQLANLRVLEERYPLELRGSFNSSDPLLNTIWQIGVDTLYPNMTDAYTDTPWRERGQWWGDAYVADHVNRVAFGDTALMRRGLLLMADSYQVDHAPGLAPNSSTGNMTDYMMLWVQSLAEAVQLTGDTSLLTETYPVLQKFMAQMAGYENRITGLLSFPKAHWWLFAYVDMYGSQNRYGQSTVINALYADTLQKAAFLAEQAGDPVAAGQWQKRSVQVRTTVNEFLFSSTQQRYLATYYQGYYEPPTLHAQVWPLAYQLPAEENRAAATESMLKMLSQDPTHPNMGLYGMYWVFEALGQNGFIEEALNLIRSYYGYLLSRGATTWWERTDAERVWSQSLSHAWSGSPTWFLTTYVLGVRQVGPTEWQMRPALTGVESAAGVLPLGEHALVASWQQRACGEYEISLASPAGTSGDLILPNVAANQSIAIDGEIIWQNGLPVGDRAVVTGQTISIHLEAGEYIVSVRQTCP